MREKEEARNIRFRARSFRNGMRKDNTKKKTKKNQEKQRETL